MGQRSSVPRDVRRRFKPLFRMIDRTYGSDCVSRTALLLMGRASIALGPLTLVQQRACVSVAMKFVEDDPCGMVHVFPDTDIDALRQAEWSVLHAVDFKLTGPAIAA